MKQRFCLLLVFLLLNACTTVQVTEPDAVSRAALEAAYKDRAELVGAVSAWSLVGRISIDNGEEGGSGKLQWVVKADYSSINFHAAMGRGAWRLESGAHGAVLRLADGSEHFAPGVDVLVQNQIGWPIPVEALQWWVLGLAAPGPVDDQQLGIGGLLVSLRQFGWKIDFNRYASEAGLAMPTRLDARRDNYRVKLAISRWNVSGNDVVKN